MWWLSYRIPQCQIPAIMKIYSLVNIAVAGGNHNSLCITSTHKNMYIFFKIWCWFLLTHPFLFVVPFLSALYPPTHFVLTQTKWSMKHISFNSVRFLIVHVPLDLRWLISGHQNRRIFDISCERIMVHLDWTYTFVNRMGSFLASPDRKLLTRSLLKSVCVSIWNMYPKNCHRSGIW